MSPVIVARQLGKWYGDIVGINGVELEMEGGIVGLLGPNGAGKSTLLKLITGQLRPTRGTIRVLDEVPWGNSKIFEKVGYVPENDLVYAHLSGFQFLHLMAQMYGYSGGEARQRAERALEEVGMSSHQNKSIASYSKGMRQRIKVARAILHDPKLLILDEPFTGMDPVGRKHLMDFFRRFVQQGERHILFSSHILHEVEALTHSFVLIHKGKIRAVGEVDEIRSLMNRFPHRIYLQTASFRELGSRLVFWEEVRGVEIVAEKRAIVVLAQNPSRFYQRLPSLIVELGIEVEEIFSEDDNLEAVFRYLVKK
ncbi:MAG: ABC transporter ATP-binding protein [Planctomycetota bacterium]|nr:MAG: ABC transporter ATP-binding protein [Planctomycetota bacterium]